MRILSGRGFATRSWTPMALVIALVIGLAAIGMIPDGAGAVKKSKGQVGYLGVSLQKLTDEIIEGLNLKIKSGVLVNEVFADSPAEEAGLQDGDVILVYDGEKVGTPGELVKLVQKTAVGERVRLKVARETDTKTIAVVIGEKPEDFTFNVYEDQKSGDLHKKLISYFKPGVQLGVKIQDLEDADLAEYFDVDEGVLVVGVIDESAAQEAGVKAGDVITGLNDDAIASSEELIEKVQDMETGDEFELVVIRHGREKKLTGEIKEGEKHSRFMIMGDGDDHFSWTPRMDAYTDALKDARKNMKTYRFHVDNDELRSELEDLRDELKKLKDELKDKLKELEEE